MPPAFSWFLAVRYLVTRWVNLIGMLGVALAVWAMIVVVAVFSGFIGDTRRTIHEASPDLLVTAMRKEGADFGKLETLLMEDPGIAAVAPRLSHDAILFPIAGWQLAKKTDTIGAGSTNYVLLLGIDPEAEAKTTGFQDWLRAVPKSRPTPRLSQPSDYAVEHLERPFAVSPERIARAARTMRLQPDDQPLLGDQDGMLVGLYRLRGGDRILPGQRVDVISARFVPSPGTNGGFQLRKIKMNLHLAGAFTTDHRLFDQGTCFVDIDLLRAYLGEDPLGERQLVSEVAVRVKEGVDITAVAARINAALQDIGGGKALTWEDQNATYLDAVNRERTLMKIVLFAVLVVAGFLIFATLHMMVVQKTKDIGILTSMGATSGSIGAIFVISSLAVGLAGCILGLTTGFLSAFFLNDICAAFNWQLFPETLYAIHEVPIDLETSWMLKVAAGALALSLLVAWLPARRAARQDPIKALMHE